MSWRAWPLWLATCALGCESPSREAPAAAASMLAKSEPIASQRPAAPKSPPAARTQPKSARPALRRLSLDADRQLVGELGANGKKVRVVVATRSDPLAPRAPAAYRAIAEMVAPGLVPETSLHALPLGDVVLAVSDARTRTVLDELRVLGDGKVLTALIALPSERLTGVDLGDVRDGKLAWSWESKLVTREPPPAELTKLLASYQSLLAVDHLVANLARREVLYDQKQQALVAVLGNDVFSPRGVDDAVGSALVRLGRHLVFSASLVERLGRVQRAAVERALRRSPDGSLLVTPKQLDEIFERKRTLEKSIETRIRQRGRERALALP